MQDQLNSAIRALTAGIGGVAELTNDISAGTNAVITQSVLNDTHALFGDKSQSLVSMVMSGSMYHKLIGEAITNTNTIFTSGTVTVVDILGKPILVTDSPALTVTTTLDKVLSLASGAAVVEDNGDFISNLETTNGKDRIETTYQAQYSFNLGIKGFTWDKANGGASPTDAEVSTATNWDKTATYDKACAGVVTIGDQV